METMKLITIPNIRCRYNFASRTRRRDHFETDPLSAPRLRRWESTAESEARKARIATNSDQRFDASMRKYLEGHGLSEGMTAQDREAAAQAEREIQSSAAASSETGPAAGSSEPSPVDKFISLLDSYKSVGQSQLVIELEA